MRRPAQAANRLETTDRSAMRSVATGLLFFLSFGVAGYVVFAYGMMPLGALVHPDMKASFLSHATAIYLHAFASIAALVLGPFQFSASFRQRRPALHRWAGRLYLTVGVLAGGLSGLYLSQHAFGGPVARLGFAVLAGLWMFTGLRAYLAVRRGAFEAHRRWMVRNFSLTLAAVTLRIYLPLSVVLGIGFAHAYPVVAWLCWMPNLVLAEWLPNRGILRKPA